MGKYDEYLDRAKDLAEDAGNMAKNFADNVVSRAREITDEGSKVRELKKNAAEQASSFALGAREKVQGMMQDARAGKEIRQAITDLQALPEFEGSILYSMELEAMINDLNALMLIVNDSRLDDSSVLEEVRKVAGKVQPSSDIREDDAEQQAIEKAKAISFSACIRVLDAFESAAGSRQ